MVERDGIDSRSSSGVSEVLLTTNTGDPNSQRPKIRPSAPYWMSCVVGTSRRAGEGKGRLSTRGALGSVTGLVHMIRTATVPSAKTRFRSCEQRCFGPPASVLGTDVDQAARAARDAPRRPPHCPEQVYCCLYRGYRPHSLARRPRGATTGGSIPFIPV